MKAKVRDKYIKILLPTSLVAGLLILWQILSNRYIINPALFSSPLEIWEAIRYEPKLTQHILHSIYRLFIAVLIGYPLGALIGVLVARAKRISFLEDIVAFFMSIPGISWAPIFIIILGFGDRTIILVGVLTAFFPALYNMVHGMKAINQNVIRLTEILEYSPARKFFTVFIPASSTYLINGLKEAFARSWRTIIAVEMIAATMYGLGYMTFDARELLNSSTMFLGILLSGLIYIIIEIILIGALEKVTIVRWGMKVKDE